MGRPLILFGAGASHGSDTCGTPPVMRGLSDELCRRQPKEWGALPDALASDFRNNFEAAMRDLLQHDANRADVLQRAMASYFFHFQPHPTNLYVNLADRIRKARWDGVLATLNYERLLELSVRTVGLNVVVGGPKPDFVELCLPHGCCHLFTQVRVVGNIKSGVDILYDSPGIRAIEDPVEHARELRENNVPPVMSYIEPDKRNKSGVSFIKSQRTCFGALATSASLIAIIGLSASARPRDAHIWEPLARTPARIIYCGGPCGAKEYTSWASESRAGRQDLVLEGYFREEFDAICRQVGLS